MEPTTPSKTREKKGGRGAKLVVFNIFLVVLLYYQYIAFPKPATDETAAKLAQNSMAIPTDDDKPSLFVTVLLPSVVNEKGAIKRLKAIQETWGPRARAVFVVAHDFPTQKFANLPSTPSKEYPQILKLPKNLKENDVSRLKYIIEQIREQINPDFAFYANDHSFVIPEHVCHYLQGREPTDSMYEGHAMQTQEHVFNSGAAGYFLSRSTMTRLVNNWAPTSDNLHCNFALDPSSQKHRFLQKSPGLFLASCLKNGLNIKAIDTRYMQKYHRYHAFPLTRLVAGKIDGWYRDKLTQETAQYLGTDPSYAVLLDGEECCAPTSASFHYVEDLETRALFAVRQRLLSNPAMSDKDLQKILIESWPKTFQEFGGYNQGLPEQPNEWNPFLATIRKISNPEFQQTC